MSDAKPNIQLKLKPVYTDGSEPWLGDALNRKPFADTLTNLFNGQQEPLVITINGSWGTGKTFFLKNWKLQLQKEGYQAIYFNAWEDDYCDDPLIAIIGQLWESLKDTDLNEIGVSIKEAAKPLFIKTLFKAVNVVSGGVADITETDFKSRAEHTLDDYFELRGKKDELKRRLVDMANQVVTTTSKPLVFIIDELDRCRPTFAIELLERVKHIFDVPNMVFVLGIDRTQLARSIRSVYGLVDVEGYLRRFFDMETVLPQTNLAPFIEHLLKRHGLDVYFAEMSRGANTAVHQQEFGRFQHLFGFLCHNLRLSLRDAEYATRSFILVAKNVRPLHFFYPELLTVLILLRLKNQNLYRKFLAGVTPPGAVLDYFATFIPELKHQDVNSNEQILATLDMTVYMAINSYHNPVTQKLEIARTDPKTTTDFLSKRMKEKSDEEFQTFVKMVMLVQNQNIVEKSIGDAKTLRHLATQIELASTILQPGGES